MSRAPDEDYARRTLAGFVAALGSAQPTPGSGAAAGLVLALAAGCVAKAAAVSLKHAERAPLRAGAEEARALADACLAGAAEEAETFQALLRGVRRETPDGPARQALGVADGLETCAAAVAELADRLRAEVAPALAGDLLAAETLVEAARRILAANASEAAALIRRAP